MLGRVNNFFFYPIANQWNKLSKFSKNTLETLKKVQKFIIENINKLIRFININSNYFFSEFIKGAEKIKKFALNFLVQTIVLLPEMFLFHTFHNLAVFGFAIGFIFNKEVQKLAHKIDVMIKSCKTRTEKMALYGTSLFFSFYTFSTIVTAFTIYRSTRWGAHLFESRLKKYRENKRSPLNEIIPTTPTSRVANIFKSFQILIKKIESYILDKANHFISYLNLKQFNPIFLKIEKGLTKIKDILVKILKITSEFFLFHTFSNVAIIGLAAGFIFNKKVQKLARKIDIVKKSYKTGWEKVELYLGGGFLAAYTLPTTVIGIALYRSMQWGVYLYQSRLKKFQDHAALQIT